MIVADLRDNKLNNMRDVFNELLRVDPNVTSYSHYELEVASNKQYTAMEWREFKLNDVISNWLDEELHIQMKDKAFDLIKKAGENNSTATNQALASTLNYLEKKKTHVQNPTVFIYSFVPLSEMEEHAPNVKTLENIPTEIRNAIVQIK